LKYTGVGDPDLAMVGSLIEAEVYMLLISALTQKGRRRGR
jgi:hypothetical protein